MNTYFQHTLILAACYLLIFSLGEILYHKCRLKAEYTRKFVHASSGLLSFTFPVFIVNHWYVLLLCSSFLLILLSSLRFNLLMSINAVDRVTRGSILFPFVVYTTFLLAEYKGSFTLFYLPILILALCDPIAALVGRKWPIFKLKYLNKNKSFGGTMAFFLLAFVLSIFFLMRIEAIAFTQSVVIAFVVGLISSLAELLAKNGYDNLSIPYSVSFTLILMMV